MKNEEPLSPFNYKTYEFEDMLEMDSTLDATDNLFGDMDIANLIDNNWIFENISSVAFADSSNILDDSLCLGPLGATDAIALNEGCELKDEGGGDAPFCDRGQGQFMGFGHGEGGLLGGGMSSGDSSPDSGHFTGNNCSSDEHSASPETSPPRNYDSTPVDEYICDSALNVWPSCPPGVNVGGGSVQMECLGSSGQGVFLPLQDGETDLEKQQQLITSVPMVYTNAQLTFGPEVNLRVPQYNNSSPTGSSSSDSTESYEMNDHDEMQSVPLPMKNKRVPIATQSRQLPNSRETIQSNKAQMLKRPRAQQSVQASELSSNKNGLFYFQGLARQEIGDANDLNRKPDFMSHASTSVLSGRINGPPEVVSADVYGPKRARIVQKPNRNNNEAMLEVATQKTQKMIHESDFEELEEKGIASKNLSLVQLTDEEVAVYESECLPLPKNGGPLSRMDEKNLKRVRRKLKNKWSAQESRRKKKEYLETLEEKCNSVSSENSFLKRRVSDLEYDNRTLMGQLSRLQDLISSFGSTTLKCTSAATAGMMSSSGSAAQPGTSRNTNGNNSTVLMMFTVLLATMVSILAPCLTDLQASLLSDSSFITTTGDDNRVASSSSAALRNLRSSAFLLSPFAPTKVLLGQQFSYKSFQEEMKSRVLFTPPEVSTAEANSPTLPRVSDKSQPIAGTEKWAKPLIGYDVNERHLELWLSEQNDEERERWVDFSEDDTPLIIASTMEYLDHGLEPVSMRASMYYPTGGDASVNLTSNGSQQVRYALNSGVQAPVCCQPRMPTSGYGFGDFGNVTVTHGLCF